MKQKSRLILFLSILFICSFIVLYGCGASTVTSISQTQSKDNNLTSQSNSKNDNFGAATESSSCFDNSTSLPTLQSAINSSSVNSSNSVNNNSNSSSIGNSSSPNFEAEKPSTGLPTTVTLNGLTFTILDDNTYQVTDFDNSTKTVSIPETINGAKITSIGWGVFRDCGNLTSIEIPNSVTSIDDYAFEGCSSLQYNKYDNAYYLGNKTNPYVVLFKVKSEDITYCKINANTKVIYSYAFFSCSKLTSITIPNSVTSIGMRAFIHCRNLENVTISNSVTSIGDHAFYICDSLTSITIPNSVAFIGKSAFEGCYSLKKVIFENKNGWRYLTSSTSTRGTDITNTDLENTSIAAEYLTSTYKSCFWKRN